MKKELEEAGWTVKSIEEERSDYNEGLIIGQSIEKGSAVDIEEENEITFYVAKEPKKSTSSNSSKKSSDK